MSEIYSTILNDNELFDAVPALFHLPVKKRNLTFTKAVLLLLESTSYVWATAFGRDVGDSKKPLTLSARYLASWLAFLSLIFINVYVARLMAEIVEQEPIKPFTNLQDPEVITSHIFIINDLNPGCGYSFYYSYFVGQLNSPIPRSFLSTFESFSNNFFVDFEQEPEIGRG